MLTAINSFPAIYAPNLPRPPLSAVARVVMGCFAIACLGMLVIGAKLQPDPSGVSTHSELGLNRCDFLYRTGLPCPTCGMTTSVTHLVHGNLLASLYVQPMGTLVGLIAAAAVWVCGYCALTGRPAARLLNVIPGHYYLLGLLGLGTLAWAWKIFIHLRGIDGWR